MHTSEHRVQEAERLNLQVSTIVRSIIMKCKEEGETRSLLVPLNNYEERASNYTGIAKSVMDRLLECDIVHEVDEEPFDVFERTLVMKSLLKRYSLKHTRFPTFEDIYELVREAVNVRDAKHFRYRMIKMGFNYKKTTKGFILAEDMKLAFDRYNYLKKMKRARELKMPIFYIDERTINQSHTFRKPDFGKADNITNQKVIENGMYFYHVLSVNGLENYLFTNKKCKDTYKKWIFDVMLKVINPPAIIVIDDHPLHGELNDKTITLYSSKSDMLHCLREKNIPCSPQMQRAELYELISKSVKLDIDFDLDRILRAHGFEVLRLPFGCNYLSCSNLFWKEFSNKIDKIDDFSAMELEEKLIPAVTSFHWVNWKKMEERIKFWEKQFMEIDIQTDKILDEICTFDVSQQS